MKEFLLNTGWQFKESGASTAETVTIPHTVHLEPLDVSHNKQGIFEYEKTFSVPALYKNQRVFLEFEAVMTNCKVYVNDKFITEHFGGYLPFCLDVTQQVTTEKENRVFVLVDNHDDKDTPPGKPTEGLDFLYYGGIYRNVKLVIQPEVYFTHPLDKSVSYGGTRIDTRIHANSADVQIQENIKSTAKEAKAGKVTYELLYKGETVQTWANDFSISANGECLLSSAVTVQNPHLWSVEQPHLYTLRTTITYDKQVEAHETTFGIRSIAVDENGLYLNQKKMHLFGLNRGQQFPYLGIAASDEAQRREARLLKESRVNCLRLAHYPHSPAFIEECDKLGILLIDPVPGWQFLGGKVWQERLEENLIELVRRDRNHPSVVIFEVTPNETNWSTKKGDLYLRHLHEIVKEECSGALTGGDTVGRKNALVPNFDIPYTGKDKSNFIQKHFRKDNRLQLTREYGDWGFGGNKSTSRVSRGDGELAMQIQTWNYQYTHNDNYREQDIIGDLIWESIDHNRGYYPKAPISKSGIYDIFRIPKLSYQFVRSQANAQNEKDFVIFLQALTWENKKRLVFYSNCDRLKLFGDGKLLAEAKADNGADNPFDKKKSKQINDNYWMTNEDHIATSEKACPLAKHAISCMFDGGNCQHMDFPPFTFTDLDLKGVTELKVEGFHENACVKTEVFKQQTPATKLEIDAQTFDLPLKADDNDFIFVHIKAVNDKGTVDTSYQGKITLEVENGATIGHESISAEVGIAGFLVKANCGVKELLLNAQGENNLSTSVSLPVV